MVPQEGLEPPTYCLEGSCPIHLGYWGVYLAGEERFELPSLVLETRVLATKRPAYVDQETGFEPAPSVWRTDMLTINTIPGYSLEGYVGIEPTNNGFAGRDNNHSVNNPYGTGAQSRTETP